MVPNVCDDFRVAPNVCDEFRVVPNVIHDFIVVPNLCEDFRVVPNVCDDLRIALNVCDYLRVVPNVCNDFKILKSLCDIISPCLTNIINKSVTTGVFPDRLKKVRVTPILKEGDKCNLSNYRPISVLPVLGKVFGKIAYTQLYDYLENNSILHKQYHGFRAKKSTTQAILHFLQYLYKHICGLW